MADVMTTATITPAIQEYYDRVLLKRALPYLVHTKWAQRRPIEKGHGLRIKFRKYHSLDPATTPLTEGITPKGNSLNYSEVTATLSQYGDYVIVSDLITLVSPDKILTEAVELLGEQEGETIDILMRDIMNGGTNVVWANGAAGRTAVDDRISTNDLKLIIRAMKNAKVRPVTKIINPSTGVGTVPVPKGYWAIVHPDVSHTLVDLDGFVPVEKYPSQATVAESEIGSYKGIRFIETTNAKVFVDSGDVIGFTGNATTSGVNCDVYTVLIFGADAYGECPLNGATSGVIIKAHSPKDTSDLSDPLNQRSSAGWKAAWAGAILQDDWIIRYECAAAA